MQQVMGTFLYYSRAIDSAMLVALSMLAAVQVKGTKVTAAVLTKFLNYCTTNPEVAIKFCRGPMVLQACSHTGGYYNRGGGGGGGGGPCHTQEHPNGPILATTGVLWVVVCHWGRDSGFI